MAIEQAVINIGIGFVTGRKNFKDVARAYLKSWAGSRILGPSKYAFHLFVAYDLTYKGTTASDYRISDDEILDMVASAYYINTSAVSGEVRRLLQESVITSEEAGLMFGEGYAKKRNAVLYFAVKHRMDHLIFFDDDEYPIAVLKYGNEIAWKGQDPLSVHLRNITHCDITHGYHCGYISPIPALEFGEALSEHTFQRFIQCVSNDIITWASVKEKLETEGSPMRTPGRFKTRRPAPWRK